MAAKERKKRRLMLDCDICGEPVYLSGTRYVELVRAGEKPRCRKNGCEQLCGAKNVVAARTTEVLDVISVTPSVVVLPRRKRGNRNGALAKLRVSRDQRWRCESVVEADERNET